MILLSTFEFQFSGRIFPISGLAELVWHYIGILAMVSKQRRNVIGKPDNELSVLCFCKARSISDSKGYARGRRPVSPGKDVVRRLIGNLIEKQSAYQLTIIKETIIVAGVAHQ